MIGHVSTSPDLIARLKQRYAIILILTVFLIVCGISLNNIVIYTPDSARYVIWAKSLAFLQGFYDDTAPDPSRYVIHAPLYSLLLAPVARFFPYSVIAAKIVTALAGALLLVFFYQWTRHKLSTGLRLASCCLLAFNPFTTLYSTQVLSDVPFALCLILLFVLVERDVSGTSRFSTIAILALMSACVLLREVGVAVILAVMAFFALLKKYERAAIVFCIPLLVYILWIIRNEVIVAGEEIPSLRNSQFFLTHFFTPQQASLFDELKERVWNNLNIYKDLVGTLLFLPDFTGRTYSVVSTDSPLVQFVQKYVNVAKYPIMILTITLTIFGFVSRWKQSTVPKLSILFLASYFIPLLLYPINDVRFLFPLLVIMLYHFAIGLEEVTAWIKRRFALKAGWAQWGILALCILPVIVWQYDVAANSFYHKKIYLSENRTDALSRLPEYFRRPLDLAGKWLSEHSDSSSVVGTVWKEMSFWLGDRKVVELNPHIVVDAFDHLIRDYRVDYLVVVVGSSGREFEIQMAQSRKFQFLPLYRIGNLAILKVEDKEKKGSDSVVFNFSPAQSSDNEHVQDRLRHGFELLNSHPAEAESVFKDLWNTRGGFATIAFYTAVAKEFADSLERAENLFRRFRTLQQSGALLTQAWYHQEIISRLKEAQRESNPADRAYRFQVLAVNYWELGFRTRAMQMLQRSLEADSTFFPSLVFGSVYSLLNGDSVESRRFLKRAAPFEPSNEVVRGLTAMFRAFDSLRIKLPLKKKAGLRITIAREYVRVGLRENAIDELLDVLRQNPNQEDSLRLLAEIYLLKRRLKPARLALERLLEVNWNDMEAQKKLEKLKSSWFTP